MQTIEKVTLYSSEGCHLCEQALEICLQAMPASNIHVVDIVESDSLVDKYGVHIPVLVKQSGQELYWPFSLDDVIGFIN